jgi:hypothetical protein
MVIRFHKINKVCVWILASWKQNKTPKTWAPDVAEHPSSAYTTVHTPLAQVTFLIVSTVFRSRHLRNLYYIQYRFSSAHLMLLHTLWYCTIFWALLLRVYKHNYIVQTISILNVIIYTGWEYQHSFILNWFINNLYLFSINCYLKVICVNRDSFYKGIHFW